jgi:hypothetical protein
MPPATRERPQRPSGQPHPRPKRRYQRPARPATTRSGQTRWGRDPCHRALEPARVTVADLERGPEPGDSLPKRAVGLDHRAGPAGRRDRLRTPDHHGGAGAAAGRAVPGHRRPRPSGGDQPGGGRALAGHEPAAARLPEDRARPGALLHHRPPRRRAGPGGQLPGRRSSAAAVGPVPGQHADDRRDGGRRAGGGDRRAGGPGGRGATTVAVVAGAVAFLVVWAALFLLQRRALDPLRRTTPRFPTPPDEA